MPQPPGITLILAQCRAENPFGGRQKEICVAVTLTIEVREKVEGGGGREREVKSDEEWTRESGGKEKEEWEGERL